jgi:hypothetical protein
MIVERLAGLKFVTSGTGALQHAPPGAGGGTDAAKQEALVSIAPMNKSRRKFERRERRRNVGI